VSGFVDSHPKWTRAGAATWLSLAAAPTFAVMGLLTAVHSGGMPDMVCSMSGGGLSLSGMATMYTLMSAFHLGPWLRLLPRR
jgi:hypothetical protein